MTFALTIYGLPAPQGSKDFKGLNKRGRPILVESSAALKPWREAVVLHALRHIKNGAEMVSGPVSIETIFTLPRPQKPKWPCPATRPDLDKLQRAVWDALALAGAIEDDGRIVASVSAKRYPNEGIDALDRPGVLIRLRPFVAAFRR